MKAVYIQRHGPVADLKVSDVPAPGPGTHEVLLYLVNVPLVKADEPLRASGVA
jgi:NADPH:quinone reductase-like Zn-dependent oxidoreductase